jgi:hypothetical protein
MQIFIVTFHCVIYLLAHNIISFAQTPTPVLSIGQSYSPYSRIGLDQITFACSFSYSTTNYNSGLLSFIYLDFKFASTGTTASSSDAFVATFYWSSYSAITSGNPTSNIPNAYSNRVTAQPVKDSGPFKNYSIILGVSTYTSTPNYYTPTDMGYYYCAIRDSYTTTSATTGNFVYLNAYYPVTATSPSWTNVAAGSSVSMSCTCSSYPSSTVLWQQYQPDNSSAVWTNSSLSTATTSSATTSTGVITVTSTYSWSVGQNSDGSATYFRYSFRCYCYHTAYSTTYYTSSSGVEFLPTFSLTTPALYYASDKTASWLQSKTLISSYGSISYSDTSSGIVCLSLGNPVPTSYSFTSSGLSVSSSSTSFLNNGDYVYWQFMPFSAFSSAGAGSATLSCSASVGSTTSATTTSQTLTVVASTTSAVAVAGLAAGWIVFIVLGGVAIILIVIALIVILIICLCRRCRRQKKEPEEDPNGTANSNAPLGARPPSTLNGQLDVTLSQNARLGASQPYPDYSFTTTPMKNGDTGDGYFPEEQFVEDKPRSRRPINMGPDAPDILEPVEGEMGAADGFPEGYDESGMGGGMPVEQQAGFGYGGQGTPMAGGSLHALSPGPQGDAGYGGDLNSPTAVGYQQQQPY